MKNVSYCIILLLFIFISGIAWAQIPSCPCDNSQGDGVTGNEIIEQVCPGGELADGASYVLNNEVVSVALGTLGYEVITSSSACFVENNGDQGGVVGMSPEDLLDCRQRLIEGCDLINKRNVPTISQWGLITTAGVLGIIGFIVIRRKKVNV